MGSASSLNNNTIYISYPETNMFTDTIYNILSTSNYSVINSSMSKQYIQDKSVTELNKQITYIFENIPYIIMCLSNKTIRSIVQAIEINNLPIYSDNTQIIYLMLDSNYTPDTNVELYKVIKDKIWFPLYDELSTIETSKKIISCLSQNII